MTDCGRLFTMIVCRKTGIYRKAAHPDANNRPVLDLVIRGKWVSQITEPDVHDFTRTRFVAAVDSSVRALPMT